MIKERPRLLIQRLARLLVVASPLVLVVVVLLALGMALARRPDPGGAFGVNAAGRLGSLAVRSAADFSLERYDGSVLRMADLRGQGVVLNFWASWCVPCREEAPLLARVAREYEPQSVVFVGISLWDPASDAKAFLSRYGIGYPNGPDHGGKIAIEYGLTGIPETFFVRADGTLSRRWVGPIAEAQLRAFIEEIRP